MSSFINIRGSIVDLDVFGQIQPSIIKTDDKTVYRAMFYDKDLNHRVTYAFESEEELYEFFLKLNSFLNIQIKGGIKEWLEK